MTLQDDRFKIVATSEQAVDGRTDAGEADESGMSPQHLVLEADQPTVKSDIVERQAVEVRPMRYVLGIGIALAIVALLAVWTLSR
jgi:hypothetical protein